MSTYCLRCKKKTHNKNEHIVKIDDRNFKMSQCDICGAKKSQIMPGTKTKGKGVYEFLEKHVAPHLGDSGLTLPKSNYCGPFNRVDEEYQKSHPPTNRVDSICLRHDLNYNDALKSKHSDKSLYAKKIREADDLMLRELRDIKNPTVGERLLRAPAYAGIKAKSILDKHITGNGKQNLIL